MRTNRFLKGLAVGAAGGALVLAGVAGTGTVASAAPSQDATVNASPDRDDQHNIYNLLQGDLKGKSGSWDESAAVHGGWLQGAIGELQVKDHNGTHSWDIKDAQITRGSNATLKLKIQIGGVWNSGTLQGTVKNTRVTIYDGTLDSSGSDHIRITNFKVQSEFRGYDVYSGKLRFDPSGTEYKLTGGCIFRGKGHFVTTVPGYTDNPVSITFTADRGSITTSGIELKNVDLARPDHAKGHIAVMTGKGAGGTKVHIYSGSGATAPSVYTLTGLDLGKRNRTTKDCTPIVPTPTPTPSPTATS